MSASIQYYLGALGEIFLLVGGLLPLAELVTRGKRRDGRWLLRQFIREAKNPSFIQIGHCRPIFVMPRDYAVLESIRQKDDKDRWRVAIFAAFLMILGSVCVIICRSLFGT
jgi:hypothetical protein